MRVKQFMVKCYKSVPIYKHPSELMNIDFETKANLAFSKYYNSS